MWVLFAFASAFFAGVTSILAKIGVKDVDSHEIGRASCRERVSSPV